MLTTVCAFFLHHGLSNYGQFKNFYANIFVSILYEILQNIQVKVDGLKIS